MASSPLVPHRWPRLVACPHDPALAGGRRWHGPIPAPPALRLVPPPRVACPVVFRSPRTFRLRFAVWRRAANWSTVFGFAVCELYAAYVIWEALR